MKKYTIALSMALMFAGLGISQSLAFRQGSFQINVTEGNTFAHYDTYNYETQKGESQYIIGCRDPLQLEYGITKHWGIGITSGADIYNLDPTNPYGLNVSNNQIKASTSEFTIDGSYHFFTTRITDISAVFSYGGSTVSFNGSNGSDGSYSYKSSGDIVRFGLHGRFFVLGHFGIVAMFTAFSQTDIPQVPKDFVGTKYSTSISGFAKEFGICYRIRK
ncbi:MAG TPA: hypothetical protein VK783_01260 [Bacteroidia bacterium]|jgi:hypothetical protein|nr:hypothetical protein [Bacteroidia bacterium]